MILIVTALMIEATPIIEYFKLKKDMYVHEYPLYKNSDIMLIVGGVGKVKSAMAAMYLLSICKENNNVEAYYEYTKKNILINIGFCGAGSEKYNLGSLLIINKITDMDTGKDFYPDIFLSSELPKEAICCYSKPIYKEAIECSKSTEDFTSTTDIFCDMESSGIMEVAKKFTYTYQVVILKVISDYLTPEKLDKELLQSYLREHMPDIDKIIREVKQLDDSCNKLLSADSIFLLKEENKMLGVVSDNLKFSEAMKQLMLKEIKKARQKGIDTLKILELFIETKANSKVEGKKFFEQIYQKLK